MDFEVKGAYRLLLDLIYQHGGQLSDDPRFIAGHLGCSVKKWNGLRAAIIEKGKICVSDGYLTNLRADKELDSLKSFQDKQRKNASEPRKINELGLAMDKPKPSHTEPDTDNKKRDTNVSPKVVDLGQKAKATDEAFDRFWQAYPQKGRTGKKAVLDKFRLAVKHGVDPERIVQAASAYCQTETVIRGFPKNAITWINQGCWDDEAVSPTQSGSQSNFWTGNKVFR